MNTPANIQQFAKSINNTLVQIRNLEIVLHYPDPRLFLENEC